MREIIKKVLAEWLLKLTDEMSDEDRDRLVCPDRSHLMGAAIFLMEVADKSNDMELLGIATQTRRVIKEKIVEEITEFQEQNQQQQEEHDEWERMEEAVKNACRPVFLSNRDSVNMSKHRKAIEDSRLHFTNPSDYVTLLLYADDRKVFKRVCAEVRTAAWHAYNKGAKPPEPEWIRQKFLSVLSETYHRAEKHVAQQIKRCTPQNPIPPIAIDQKS